MSQNFKQLTINFLEGILKLSKEGFSPCEISKNMGILKSTINYHLTKYKKQSYIDRKSGSGRCRSLGEEEITTLLEKVEENSKISSKKLANIIVVKVFYHHHLSNMTGDQNKAFKEILS